MIVVGAGAGALIGTRGESGFMLQDTKGQNSAVQGAWQAVGQAVNKGQVGCFQVSAPTPNFPAASERRHQGKGFSLLETCGEDGRYLGCLCPF